MANPSRTNQEANPASTSFTGGGGGNPINGPSAVPENSAAGAAPSLTHNQGLWTEWTAEEQLILEEGLAKYVSGSSIIRYAKIAIGLQNKTVRDVAFRCRWMSKKENSKRRKDGHNMTRKSKDKKEKVTDSVAHSSQLAALPGLPPFIQQMISADSADGISYSAIGDATGQLLEQNAQAFERITTNFAAHQIHENISLLCQARDNILIILNNLSNVPEIMKQMPPLPVRLNEELANLILPRTSV